MMRLVRNFLSAALLVSCSSLLHAQGVDPGENLLKEEQRKRQLEQLTQGTGGQEIQTPELQGPIAEAVCFPIKKIELAGVSVLELAAFDQILYEYSERCLGQVSIGYLLQRITIVYADLGYITTRAYVPAQDIGTQKLVVEVLEGRIEAFVYQQLDAQGQPKAGETRKITTAFPIKAGDVFQLRDIEHGLEQMNRLKSSQANANLAAGQAPGTSQVVITEVKSDWFRGSFGLDNRGSPDTGETQVRFSLEADDLLNRNDTYFFSYSGTRNSNALAFSASAPLRDWLFSISGSYSESLSSATQSSDLFTQTANLNLSGERLLYRDAQTKLHAYASLTSYWNRRFINIAPLSPQHRSAIKIGFKSEQRQEKYVLTEDVSLSFGSKLLGGDWDAAFRFPGTPKAGFVKLSTQTNYFRPFKNGAQLSTSISAQYSPDVLFSEQQISIGGWDSVRGYSGFSSSGDIGVYTRTEYSLGSKPLDFTKIGKPFETADIWNPAKNAKGGVQTFLFFDAGFVASSQTGDVTSLFGAGAGMNAQFGLTSLSGTLAVPLKDQNGQKAGALQATLSLSIKLF
jgi:hemolysin activation/secretion protein